MSNINLSQDTSVSSLRARSGMLDKSLGISLAIIIVAFGVYFGLVFYEKTLDSNLVSLNSSIEMEKKKIPSDQAIRVVDVQDRLDVIKKSAEAKTAPTDFLMMMENAMLPSTNLSDYAYDAENHSIETMVVADSLRSIAEQVVAFKKSFADVAVGDIKHTEDGKMTVGLTLVIR